MGVTARNFIKEKTPRSRHPDTTPVLPGVAKGLVDILIYINSIYTNNNEPISGLELYERISKMWTKALFEGNYDTFVILSDCSKNVPSEKLPTQLKRNKKSKKVVEKYPPLCEFGDEGIRMDGDAPYELIDLERLRVSRFARDALMQYFHTKFTSAVIPDGKIIYFEYDDRGPYEFSNQCRGVQHTKWAHKHGESEYSMLFWYNLFRGHPVVVFTTDSDIIPLTACYLTITDGKQHPSEIIWYNYFEPGWVNLRVLVGELFDYTGFSIKELMIFILLCGADYVLKCDTVSHQFGEREILHAFNHVKEYFEEFEVSETHGYNAINYYTRYLFTNLKQNGLSRTWDKKLGILKTNEIIKKRKIELIREEKEELKPLSEEKHLSQLMNVLSLDELRSTFVTGNDISKKHIFPTDEAIAYTINAVQFQLKYYMQDWIQYLVEPDERSRINTEPGSKHVPVESLVYESTKRQKIAA